MPTLENLFEPVLYSCYVTFYFFYYLFQGKQEWMHRDASKQGPARQFGGTPECCDSTEGEPSNTFIQRSYRRTEQTTTFATNRRLSSSPMFEINADDGIYQRVKGFITDWSPLWLTNVCSTVTSSFSASLPAEGTGNRRLLDILWRAFLWIPWLCWHLLLLVLWMAFGILLIMGRIIVNIIHSDKSSGRKEQADHVTHREQSVDNVCVPVISEGSYPIDSAPSTESSYRNVEDAPQAEVVYAEQTASAEGSSEEQCEQTGGERKSTEAVPLSTFAQDVAAFESQKKKASEWRRKNVEASLASSNETNHSVNVGKLSDGNPTEVSSYTRRMSLSPPPATSYALQEARPPPNNSLVERNPTDGMLATNETIRAQQTSEPMEYRHPLPRDYHTPWVSNGDGLEKPSPTSTESQVQGNDKNERRAANEAFHSSRTIVSSENGQPMPHEVHARKIPSGHELQERLHASSHHPPEGNTASDFCNVNDVKRYQRASDSPVYRQPEPHDVNVPKMQRNVIAPKQRSSSAAPATVVHQLPESSDNPDSPTRFVFYPRRRHSALPGNIAYCRTVYSASPQTVSPISPINDISPSHSARTRSPGVVLLGHSVFSPVREIEQIRDEFNRKAESRAASVARLEHSRPPPTMSQSCIRLTSRPAEAYPTPQAHPTSLARRTATGDDSATCMLVDGEPEAVLGRRFPSADVVRTGRPKPWTENVVSSLGTSSYGRVASPQWVLKSSANATQNALLSRMPVAGSRSVLERKVTERCSEKDADGRALNAWNNQEWLGQFEERDAAGRVTQQQSYENTFNSLESA